MGGKSVQKREFRTPLERICNTYTKICLASGPWMNFHHTLKKFMGIGFPGHLPQVVPMLGYSL